MGVKIGRDNKGLVVENGNLYAEEIIFDPENGIRSAKKVEIIHEIEDIPFEEIDGDDSNIEPKKRPGRPPVALFTDTQNNEDIEITEQEAERVKTYLSKHKLSNFPWISSQDNPIMVRVICFVNMWIKLEMVKYPTGSAIYNFFTTKCGVQVGQVDPRSITSKFPKILKHECDVGIRAEIEKLFK